MALGGLGSPGQSSVPPCKGLVGIRCGCVEQVGLCLHHTPVFLLGPHISFHFFLCLIPSVPVYPHPVTIPQGTPGVG